MELVELETPEQIIQRAIDTHKVEILVGMFSGGKDSLVTTMQTAQIAKKLDKPFEIVYCLTGVGIRENFEYVLKTCNNNNWKLTVVQPAPHETYEMFVNKFGFPGPGMHNAVMGYLKWHPLRRFCRERKGDHIGLISGRRRKESKRRERMKTFKDPISLPEKNMLMIAPLYYKSTEFIWDFIKTNKLDLCPVYQTLHMSGDCLCGSFAQPGEAVLMNIFHQKEAEFIKALEKKYGGQWGRNQSMTEAQFQKQLSKYAELTEDVELLAQDQNLNDEFTCSDCYIEHSKAMLAEQAINDKERL